MKNLLQLKVIFLIFTIIFTSQAIAADRILPIPKPTPDKETKIKTTQKNLFILKKNQYKKKKKLKLQKVKKLLELMTNSKEKFLFIQKKSL